MKLHMGVRLTNFDLILVHYKGHNQVKHSSTAKVFKMMTNTANIVTAIRYEVAYELSISII